MIQKIKFSLLLIFIIVLQGCALNQYQQIKTDKSYLVTFSSDIPKLFKTRINSSLQSKDSMSQDNIINVNISNFMFDQYDVYSGSSLRALESAKSVWLTSSTKGLAQVTDIIGLDIKLNEENHLFQKCEEIFVEKFLSSR